MTEILVPDSIPLPREEKRAFWSLDDWLLKLVWNLGFECWNLSGVGIKY